MNIKTDLTSFGTTTYTSGVKVNCPFLLSHVHTDNNPKTRRKMDNFTTLNSNFHATQFPMKFISFGLIVLSFICLGCGGNECKISKEMLSANGLDDNYCPKVDTTIKPLNKPLIKKVNIFLETSGSMNGYMPQGGAITEFQKIVPDIVDRLKSEFLGVVKFYSIFDSNTPFSALEIGTARNNILNGNFSWSGSTYLPSMLDSISKNYLADDVVNIFISDCIYSPEKKDTKETQLATTDIRSITKHFSDKFSTTAYCFYSEFRSKKYQSTKSPYYLVLQGKSENNQAIEKLVIQSLIGSKQIYESVNFGLKYNQPYYSVLPYTDKSANCIANPCESYQGAFVNVAVQSWNTQSDSMSFWIAVNLNQFPKYATTQNYLDSNLNLTMEKGVAKIISITNQVPKELDKDDKSISDNSTHYIKIEISQLDDCLTSLHLALRFSKPNWISKLNDEESENDRGKTYGLERMISGFEQAYNPDGKAYFFNDLKVSLIKQ